MLRFLPLLILSAALALLPLPSRGEVLNVSLLLSDRGQPYQGFAETLRQQLPVSVRLDVREHKEGVPAFKSDLIIAVGIKAAEMAVLNPTVPVLAVMVPKTGYDSLLAVQRPASGISAIYLDQPWDRQINFLYAVLPDIERIGLLYSSETYVEISVLLKSVANRGGSVVAQSVRSADGVFAGLERVLSGSDVLLAIPDSRIYNASSIRNILLTSYRHDVPLIGFSQGYVNAGALAAIYSTPEQLAGQTARQVIEFEQKKVLSASRYPDDFTIGVNFQVARSLGIRLPSEEDIRKRMRGEGRQ